jgi:tRNA U34 5-methylaminomethyl-2-thiouridine-forming methyltransferase MnmC
LSKGFEDKNHHLKLSEDGSYTAYSQEYGEHYHSTKDGALHESLCKHVVPALSSIEKDEIFILDICYGLGFNTLATLWYLQEEKLDKKVHIYSPELDASLVGSLEHFTYPKEFESFREIIYKLATEQYYADDNISIEIFLGDAREYVKRFEKKFDIVYQDAFSPSANPMLWTLEYFADIKKAMRKDGLVTTYSTALKTRLALYNNGFTLYTNSGSNFRTATIASLTQLSNFTLVDMEHKIACNQDVEPLRDNY